jgi:hypothetical protein
VLCNVELLSNQFSPYPPLSRPWPVGRPARARWAQSTRLGIEASLARLSLPSLVFNGSDRSAAMTMPRPSARSSLVLLQKRSSAHSHGRLLRRLTSPLLLTTLLTHSFASASRSVPPLARPTGCAPCRERTATDCLLTHSTLSAVCFALFFVLWAPLQDHRPCHHLRPYLRSSFRSR